MEYPVRIELTREENPANTCAWHTETLGSYFDLIKSIWAVYTVMSPTGDQTSDHRMQSRNSTTEPLNLHRTQVTPNQVITVYTADET